MDTTTLTGPATAKQVRMDLGDGREVLIETGKLARQAHGSAIVRMGDTMLLATVVSSSEIREGQNFFPLSVDYQEKYAAAGRVPGGFFKREGRLGEAEILISRLVDRALRPLFPDGYLNDTQVMISLISLGEDDMPDALAALAASSALVVSDIPFNGPISEVRVIRSNGEFYVNPKRSALEDADLDIIIAASMDNVVMVEGEMKQVSEQDLVEAIRFGHEAIKKQCAAQTELAAMVGNSVKREVAAVAEDAALEAKVNDFAFERFLNVAKSGINDKHLRKNSFKEIHTEFMASLGEEPNAETVEMAGRYLKAAEKKAVREAVLAENIRLDGRKLDEIRQLSMETDFLPGAHGSALFTRGETQALATATLGSKVDEQMIDNATHQGYNRFMLHYNFPAFSTGEVKPNRGPGRREVGHGNLAMRSLKQVLPSHDDFGYTIRVVSDVLESNGSSSMATVCSGSLALMDAGVPISSGVSGIAMGLITDGSRVAILSDILGDEDHLGDMDFKVTGTAKGICAVQMDIKIDGLPYDVLIQALDQARAGRHYILEEMNKVMATPRDGVKDHAPQLFKMSINKEFIGPVIGPGGKVIQEIQAETGTQIFLEEVNDRGEITISGKNKDGIQKAVERIRGIAAVPDVGEEYEGTVKAIQPYGAFVEFMPGKEGLLHISEISWKRLESMDGIFEVGDKVKVKLLSVDQKTGKFKLSRKVLLERPEGMSNGKN